ncbi:MAG: 1-deoxy-D-xylulose-5-phosphate reductoisomerase [Oscillospiraceae bacterium]|nr:1-deoxy-D-xylulose-5-phosphate reductoisomerase [Oscillospiraceae bacterium]
MTKTISILGSTGSIGRQTLDVVDLLGVRVAALTCGRSLDMMIQQCKKYRPLLAVMETEALAMELRDALRGQQTEVLFGKEGLIRAASIAEADTVVTAVVGMMGLEPTLAACRAGKRIGLANKETLVCAGELVMAEAEAHGAQIIPVDSEHSAIFQCLMGCEDMSQVKRLILTASGGAFYGMTREQLKTAKKADALRHPNWKMGPKITIDCATLLNKGLEFIEAMRLYRMPPEKISVVVHRQSIVHSLVEYQDGAVMAQLGTPDMRIPIQLALTYPDRVPSPAPALDLLTCGALTFCEPDYETFPCLGMAMEAAKAGGTACVILNGANEEAVAAYLKDEIGFYDISDSIRHALDTVDMVRAPDLEQILEADRLSRQAVRSYFAIGKER